MNLSLSYGFHEEVKVEPTLAQRQQIALEQRLTLRLELIGAINGGISYNPRGKCTRCSYELSPSEILKGFNTDPADFTTACPRCKERFRPNLVWRGAFSSAELPFYCGVQVLGMLKGMEIYTPLQLQKEQPAIYHSALVHYGLMKNAFAACGITYAFNEVADLERKIAPFLGRLPDRVIAELSGLGIKDIRRLRQQRRVAAIPKVELAFMTPGPRVSWEVSVGGEDLKKILSRYQRLGIQMSRWARYLAHSATCHDHGTQQQVTFVRGNLWDLFKITEKVLLKEFLDEDRLTERCLAFCKPTDSLYLRPSLLDQPKDQWLRVGMRNLIGASGDPEFSYLVNGYDVLWLRSDNLWPTSKLSPDSLWVFRQL